MLVVDILMYLAGKELEKKALYDLLLKMSDRIKIPGFQSETMKAKSSYTKEFWSRGKNSTDKKKDFFSFQPLMQFQQMSIKSRLNPNKTI